MSPVETRNIMKDVELTVVLLNWNAHDETCSCLRRIAGWKHLQPHICVVDNGSVDGSVEVISTEFPKVDLLLNQVNSGFSGGNNTAFKKLQSIPPETSHYGSPHFILLLNTDAFIEESDLLLLLESLSEDRQVGVTGPLLFHEEAFHDLLSAGGLDPARNGRTYWAGQEAEKYIGSMDSPYEVDYVSGTIALMPRSVINKAGLFDEDYFFSCEMADLCERIKGLGYKCTINPAAKAWHDMQSSGKQRDTLYLYYSLRNRFLFIRKFRRNKLFRLYLYWRMIAGRGMIKALLTGKFATVRAYALALRDGLFGRYGGRNELFSDTVK